MGRLLAAALAGAAVLAGAALLVARATGPGTTVAPRAPAASSTLLSGDALPARVLQLARPELGRRTSSSIGGLIGDRPAVINFFASFCSACEAEMRAFASVAAAHPGVRFVGIDTNDPNPAKALALLERARVTYPVLIDSAALAYAHAFGIANLPTTFFVDGRRQVEKAVLGTESASALRANLRSIGPVKR